MDALSLVGNANITGSLFVNNTDPTTATVINDSSGNGITLSETASGGIVIESNGEVEIDGASLTLRGTGGDIGIVTVRNMLTFSQIYNDAGNPLPDASAVPAGTRAVVSDATSPTFMGAYIGNGTVTCPVFCDGAAWYTA
jgi:hypothetical protein